ncbi:MAG TPA: hypothetical protein VFJ51_00050 [Nitrososphaeraceae archaeon]|nr:hypothetical protein [Nitrososphaeraceae archaeon]
MNHTTVSIRIVIATGLALSMVVAGISLASLQQQPGYAASQAEKHEQNTIQNVRDNFEKTSSASQQHMDQENLCLRTSDCNNSNVAEQTLGNDNSVTGFADQSKNVQQRIVVTPTPVVTPTATPTPPTALGCGTDAVFDVTLQSPIASEGLPTGTVLCLKGAGPNTGITAVLPSGAKVVADIIVDGAPSGGVCPSPFGPAVPSPFVQAAVTSGTLPAPVSGTVICVG